MAEIQRHMVRFPGKLPPRGQFDGHFPAGRMAVILKHTDALASFGNAIAGRFSPTGCRKQRFTRMAAPLKTRSTPVTAAVQKLESLRRSGIQQLPKAKRKPATAGKAQPAIAAPPASKTPAAKSPNTSKSLAGVPVSPAAKAAITPSAGKPPAGKPSPLIAGDTLPIIQAEVAGCQKCELAETRNKTVFGVGNPNARLCFLGEAPGADEDQQGEPFVGRAGQLLTRIIEACTLQRSDVYILNVLKCRPPGNRNPLPHEVTACRGYLDRQLALIRPEYICCLGTIAAQTLLETDTPIGRMRGKFFEYRGVQVMCTYHPAYLLRNPAAKKDVWEDMKVLMRKLGIELDK